MDAVQPKREKTGGRMKGTPNKATAEIREAARAYTIEAIETLAHVMRHSAQDQARVQAADKLLDRGWGKSPLAITGEDGEGAARLVVEVVRFFGDDDGDDDPSAA